MYKNMLAYCELKKTNVFDYVPITFVLEVNSTNYAFELDKFISYFNAIDKAIEQAGNPKSTNNEAMSELLVTINQKFSNQPVQKDSIYAKRKIPFSHFKA